MARGYSTLQVKSRNTDVKASKTVFVNLWNGAKCDGGQQQIVSLTTPDDWCEYYGARQEDGCAIVYKGADEKFVSKHGVTYTPGTTPSDPAWDGLGKECSAGGGLNFSPTPRHTHEFCTPAKYLECRVKLEDMIIHWDGSYPQKICAKQVAAPLIEVDVDGNPVLTKEGHKDG